MQASSFCSPLAGVRAWSTTLSQSVSRVRLGAQYDVARFLGQAYCHVLFQERFSLSDDDWNALFASKWFPFAGLRDETINDLVSHVRAGWGQPKLFPHRR